MSSSRKDSGDRHVATLRPGPIVPVPRVAASTEQRRKVERQGCMVCGRRPADPAHLVPQRLGGCGNPDCVVALCRTHHRLYDSRRLALAPYLGRGFRREMAHALGHVGATELRRALEGGGWPPPWSEGTNQEGVKP